MTKEELEDKVRKHIKDGFQVDYNHNEDLVEVFQEDEVVENIVLELDEYAKQMALLFYEDQESLLTEQMSSHYDLFLKEYNEKNKKQ